MTDARTVTDGENLTWSCVQAYAGLTESGGAETAAAITTDGNGFVPVVCTPSGGAQSVRVELPSAWAQELRDTELLAAIKRARAAQ